MAARIFAASDPRHGKRAGYDAHRRRHETPCEACTRANRERQGAKQPRTERQAYIVSEVDFLVGTDRPDNIATRLGYANYDSLKLTLDKWNRDDLVSRLEATR